MKIFAVTSHGSTTYHPAEGRHLAELYAALSGYEVIDATDEPGADKKALGHLTIEQEIKVWEDDMLEADADFELDAHYAAAYDKIGGWPQQPGHKRAIELGLI